MKQTAVEFIVRQLDYLNRERKDKLIIAETFFNHKRNLIEEAKIIEKENMINFLKSAFAMEGFDYETFYDKFISEIAPYEQELPKTQIDWSGFPKSTQEQVGFTEPNVIDEWLNKNGNPEIAKQVEQEAKELFEQEIMYSEEEVLAFGKSCFYKGFEKAENDDANCYTAFREEIGNLFEQFKNK
jgi:hypothetical protein